jgi:translation initiation factor IF-1
MSENENNLEFQQNGDVISIRGEVIELLPNAKYRVKLPNNAIILAHTSGKMRKNRIKILQYDNVNVEISISDLENLKRKDSIVNGRITFRHKA